MLHYSDMVIGGYERVRNVWVPAADLTLSEWADKKFYLSPESASEPGKWKTRSYQREPMDAMTDPENERVTLKKSARVGYTKMVNAAIGYGIEHDACSQLVVQPTIEDTKGYSKDEVAPMLRDCPCFGGLVSDPKSRDSDNTVQKKSYPGGTLTLIGANSPRGFRRLTVRKVFFDEVNGFPSSAGTEGDPVTLGEKRAADAWNRFYAYGSTPTIKGVSRITTLFEESDQRYLFVPCPLCGHYQVLRWEGIKWPKDNPGRAYYLCEKCERAIDHSHKRAMVDAGEWRATADAHRHAGFFLWAGYSFSPGAAWSEIARRFLAANQHFKKTGDYERLKTWTNTDLGEDWEERGDGVEVIEIRGKVAMAKDTAPEPVLVITAGVDIQDDRIELEVVGWGEGNESWSLDYVVLPGDTNRQDVWTQLDEQLQRRFERGAVSLRIACAVIDHGHRTHMVETFVKPRQVRRVYAGKGSSQAGKPLVSAPSKKSIRKKIWLLTIGTDTAKDLIYGRLKIEQPGPGFCHFPDDRSDEYFKQLTAEEVVVKWTKGVPRRTWKKKRRRNEALDLRVYATAALQVLNPKFDKIRTNIQRKEATAGRKNGTKVKQEKIRRRSKGGFVKNW